MKYDNYQWHYEGEFPSALPPERGATHIAMFYVWAATKELIDPADLSEWCKDQVRLLTFGDMSLSFLDIFIRCCDGTLTDEDFTLSGNAFASAYYDAQYYADYASVFDEDGDTIYHVLPSRENFDRLRPVLDRRYSEWLVGRS